MASKMRMNQQILSQFSSKRGSTGAYNETEIPIILQSEQLHIHQPIKEKKIPFNHYRPEVIEKQRIKTTSPKKRQEFQLNEQLMKDSTTSPPQELASSTQLRSQEKTRDLEYTAEIQFDLQIQNKIDETPRASSGVSTARFKNDFKTLDSNKADDELKLIKRIYDNFNKHQLPNKSPQNFKKEFQKSLKKTKDRAFSEINSIISEYDIPSHETKLLNNYQKFENQKYLFHDEIYMNQDSEKVKRKAINKFFLQRDLSHREKYIEFLRHKLIPQKTAQSNQLDYTNSVNYRDQGVFPQTQKFQDLSYLLSPQDQDQLIDRYADLNRFGHLLTFSGNKVKKSEITNVNKNVFLSRIRQKIQLHETQPLVLYDQSKQARASSQVVSLRTQRNEDKHNGQLYLEYLGSQRYILPALQDFNGITDQSLQQTKQELVENDTQQAKINTSEQSKINMNSIEQRAIDGTSYNNINYAAPNQNLQISEIHPHTRQASHNLKLKVSANVDFANDRLDLSLLKRQKMRNKKEERVRLMGKHYYLQQEKIKQNIIIMDQKRKELTNFLSNI